MKQGIYHMVATSNFLREFFYWCCWTTMSDIHAQEIFRGIVQGVESW
jgi:hypothetical protein